jgi:hypothetical protein
VNTDPIRRLTAAAVMLVATIAAVVSFVHIEALASTHGQTQLAAWLLPVSVDGTVAAASLSMLWAARSGLATPWLARCMLGLGVLATLAANVGYGLPDGVTGALLSGWPAIAFVGSVEMVLSMVRRDRAKVSQPGPAEPADVYRASVAAGSPLSIRALSRETGLSRRQAGQLVARAGSEANGHAAVVTGDR